MPTSAFAPYRLPPGTLPDEAARRAAEAAAEPLLVPLDEPLPAGLVAKSVAIVPAGRAGEPSEACRAADGSPSGFNGDLRACLVSPRHRTRVERSSALALELGFAGVCLDRPDAPLALGVLGAGFCPDCQRAFSRELAREYGDHFQPIDFLSLAREALAQSSGALGYAQLAYGRDFWRMRAATLERAVQAYARAARDAARAHGKPLEVAAEFEAVGPAQLRAARHLDAAVYPAPAQQMTTGVGPFRLLRAAMGRRPVTAALTGASDGVLARFAAVGAACGVEVAPDVEAAPGPLARIRQFARGLDQRRTPAATPVAECAILYSAECDLWTAGDHREQVERAGEALAALHVQAPVVMSVRDVPAGATIVLAGATALAPGEARELHRRVEAGSHALSFGPVGAVDEAGRKAEAPLPPGKASGAKLGKGLVAQLPALPAPRPGQLLDAKVQEPLAKVLTVVLGKVRRAAAVGGRSPLLVVLQQEDDRVEAHLVTLGAGPAQGTTLFLGGHLTGSAKRARFQSSAGADEKIPLNPSGAMVSTVLPSFEGYAVLTVPA